MSLGEAVKAVIHNYHPLVMLLEEEAADERNPVSSGLLMQLSSYRMVALLHLMGDILAVTNHLNRTFQQRNLSFHSIKSQVQ